jgi:aryl-alcohol dehydrogenase-like predicted oxidoreductase
MSDERRLPTRHLGPIEVGSIGIGCMAMTNVYGVFDEDEAVTVIRRALDRGATMIDTAEVYGPHANEELVGRAIAGRREEVVVSTKCGLVNDEPGGYSFRSDGRPETIRAACEGSLSRLGVETLDLYYLHRVDPTVPVEESVGALAALVDEGKVRGIGLCEVDTATLERASSVHPVASVQGELSLWTREVLDEVLPWCAQHDVGFVPYAPLGRGFLTGRYRSAGEFGEGDFRSTNPRFQDETLRKNLALVDAVERVAERLGATAGQVALAWVLAQGEHVAPIPGTERLAYLDENLGAAFLHLDAQALADLDALPAAAGTRY